MEREIGKWFITDESCNQKCCIHKKKDGSSVYEFEQTIDGFKGSAVIDLKDYMDDMEKIYSYIVPYGYESLDKIVEIYGSEWEFIIAECIFETDFYEYL